MDFDEYKADFLAYIITEDLVEHFDEPDPSTIARVDQAYIVPADDQNDPHGPPGTNVPAETEVRYDNRIARDKIKDQKAWANLLPGWKKKAREVALRAPIKQSARSAVAIINKECGSKTEQQVTIMVKDFTSKEKLPKQSIKSFNEEWVSGIRIMKRNNMVLPDGYVVSLYLNSLGTRYRTLDTVASVLPAAEKTLAKVMQMAIDHHEEATDEADNNKFALAASAANAKKRKYDDRNNTAYAATNACTVCHNLYHSAEECFRPGGGLQHFTSQQRHDFISKKREERGQRHQNRTWTRPTAPAAPAASQALAAVERQLAEMKDQMEVNNKANAPGASDKRELEILKQQVYQAGVDVSHAPIDYNKLSETLGYRCHQ